MFYWLKCWIARWWQTTFDDHIRRSPTEYNPHWDIGAENDYGDFPPERGYDRYWDSFK